MKKDFNKLYMVSFFKFHFLSYPCIYKKYLGNDIWIIQIVEKANLKKKVAT